MKRMNKKGFTLVELLAVIVILAVVMLIAVTAVGPIMAKARKSALRTEGIGAVDAAKIKYAADQLESKEKNCYTIAELCADGVYEKGCLKSGTTTNESKDGYYGKVVITTSGNSYTYTYSISNSNYGIKAQKPETDTIETIVTEGNKFTASDTDNICS